MAERAGEIFARAATRGRDTVSILEGNTFVVSDRRGDVDASPSTPHGLFDCDTRFLSRWILTVNGQTLNALSTDDLHYFAAQFFAVPGTGTVYVDSPLSVIRRRAVGRGFHEDLWILNHSNEVVDLDVRLEAAADFADRFEVKDALSKKGQRYHRIEPGRLVLGYRRERCVRETWISPSAEAAIDASGLRFRVHLEPHGGWTSCLHVVAAAITGLGPVNRQVQCAQEQQALRPNIGSSLDDWIGPAPRRPGEHRVARPRR